MSAELAIMSKNEVIQACLERNDILRAFYRSDHLLKLIALEGFVLFNCACADFGQ